jgi:hypothetical protein
VFGTDNRLLPYSSATARGTLLIQQFPLLQDRSRNNNNNNNNRSSSGSRGGSGGLGSSRFARGWADGASDLLGDLQRGRPRAPARGDRKNSVSATLPTATAAAAPSDATLPTAAPPPPPSGPREVARVRERELVLLVEAFRRGPGRQLLVCVTTHRVVCADGSKGSGGEVALSVAWAMPVQRTEPLLRYKLHS